MVGELFPLQSSIIIYIDLFKKFDEILSEDGWVFIVWQVLEHHFNELSLRETFGVGFFLISEEIVFDSSELFPLH